MDVKTQFSIYLINKPGVLAKVTGAIADARINITALALMDAGEHGALRIVTDDPDRTREVLARTHDRWTEAEVLVIELDNTPGAFAKVAQRLAEEHVNITYAYCTAGGKGGRTAATFKVDEMKKAMKLLGGGKAAKEPAPVKPPPNRGR